MRDISNKTFWQILIFFVLLRIVMVFLLMNNIPYTGVKMGGWWFYHGGDEQSYFSLAKPISQFEIVKKKALLGYPLFLAPFVFFTQASNIEDILKPVFITQAFLLFSLSIILVALIGKKIFKSKKIASLCAGIFCLHPYIFYILFHRFGSYHSGVGLTKGERSFISLNWLQMYSDNLSAFLVFLCFFLFFLEFQKQKPRESYLILLGILAGFSALVRTSNVLIVPIFLLGWLLKKRVKEAFLVGAFSFFSFLPQLIYNFLFLGSPFTFVYQSYLNRSIISLFSLERLITIFEKASSYIPGFIFLALFSIVFFLLGIKYLWQKDKIVSLILSLWFLSYTIFYITFSFGGFQTRFFIPMIPPFIFIIVSSFVYIYEQFKKHFSINKGVLKHG